MAEERTLALTLMEKHATNSLLNPLKAAKNWQASRKAMKASVGYKLKRAAGFGILGTGTAAYGLHKVTEDSEPRQVRAAGGVPGQYNY